MKRSTTKNALLMSALSLFLCFAMLTGTTFAWFTDTVESGVNQIVAGNLDVELYHNNKNTTTDEKVDGNTKLFQLFDKQLWEPGVMVYENLTVANLGNLALKYQLSVNVTNATKTKDGRTLADVLMVAVVEGGFNGDRAHAEALTGYTNLASFIKSGELYPADNTEGKESSKTYGIVIWWQPSDEDNYYNMNNGEDALTIDLGVKLFATQLQAEQDSFGKDYDKDSMTSVYDAQGLQAALNAGEKNITLEDDITLDQPLVIPASVTTYSLRSAAQPTVIDLNGKTINAAYVEGSTTRHIYAFENRGNLVITGNGTINARGIYNYGTLVVEDGVYNAIDNNGGAAIWNFAGSYVEINGGTFTAAQATAAPAATVMHVADGATAVVNGGTFKSDADWTYAIISYGDLTINDATVVGEHGVIAAETGKLTINGGTYEITASGHVIYSTAATITLNGGSFKHSQVGASAEGNVILYASGSAKATVNGGSYDSVEGAFAYSSMAGNITINGGNFANKAATVYGGDFANLVADGYEAKANADGTYTVAMKEGTFDQLISGAQPGDTVVIPEGTYTFPASDLKKGVTLQCTPGTVFEGTSSLNISGATVIGATFKNENGIAVRDTISGTFKDCVFEGSEALRWCYSKAGETVVFENCVIKTDFRGVHFDGMDGDVVFRNCEINGFNAIGGAGTVTFKNCTFGNDRSSYNGLNMYSNINLIDCTFNYVSGKTNFIDMEGIGKTLTIENCVATLDGKEVSILDFVGGSKLAQNSVVVDGAQLVSSNDALKAAIEAAIEAEAKASKILLANGDYSVRFTNNTSFNVDNMTIVGMGDNVNLSVSSSEAWYGRVQGNNVTFVNVNFTSSVGATGKATYNNCTISHLECASSGSAVTYVNDCEIGTFHTSVDLNSGDAYVKNSTITKAEYSGGTVMNFENCTIGELISWNTTTVLTGCTVETLDDSHMTSNTIVVNP